MGSVYPVFGVLRSGTSLVSSIVHALGVPMGTSFVPAIGPDWAPDHFWADAEFALLHNRLLCNTTDPLAYGMAIPNPDVLPDYQALIRQREQANPAWGLKDLWLPLLWPNLVGLFTHTIKPILLRRPGNSSAASYAARKDLTVPQAAAFLAPWTNAMTALEALYPTALIVNFPALVADAPGQVNQIANYLGMPFKQAAADKVLPDWQRF